MELSCFADKTKVPDEVDLKKALAGMYQEWAAVRTYVFSKDQNITDEWNYSKMGWNYRIKDRKRMIVYMMPCEGFFKASFVLGQEAADETMRLVASKEIKEIIASAKIYAEGRGVRIEVSNKKVTADILKVVDAKLNS